MECGKELYMGEERAPSWFTCSTCGQAVCEDCRRKHIMLCMAKTWGAVKEGPGGELIEVDRPRQAAIR